LEHAFEQTLSVAAQKGQVPAPQLQATWGKEQLKASVALPTAGSFVELQPDSPAPMSATKRDHRAPSRPPLRSRFFSVVGLWLNEPVRVRFLIGGGHEQTVRHVDTSTQPGNYRTAENTGNAENSCFLSVLRILCGD
jgi:hypothetical protein